MVVVRPSKSGPLPVPPRLDRHPIHTVAMARQVPVAVVTPATALQPAAVAIPATVRAGGEDQEVGYDRAGGMTGLPAIG